MQNKRKVINNNESQISNSIFQKLFETFSILNFKLLIEL